jgi:hypothetical protein
MTQFEFEVAQNLSGVEGTAEGYFDSDTHSGSSGIMKCLFIIEDTPEAVSDQCIPIFHDEFGIGSNLGRALVEQRDRIAGILTFGEDETAYASRVPQQTHLGIVIRELAAEKPLPAAMLAIPNRGSNGRWKYNSPLVDLHHRFGRITINGEVCIVESDDSVQPLRKTFSKE